MAEDALQVLGAERFARGRRVAQLRDLHPLEWIARNPASYLGVGKQGPQQTEPALDGQGIQMLQLIVHELHHILLGERPRIALHGERHQLLDVIAHDLLGLGVAAAGLRPRSDQFIQGRATHGVCHFAGPRGTRY